MSDPNLIEEYNKIVENLVKTCDLHKWINLIGIKIVEIIATNLARFILNNAQLDRIVLFKDNTKRLDTRATTSPISNDSELEAVAVRRRKKRLKGKTSAK